MSGYRKFAFGLVNALAYLYACWSLCYLALGRGADPTALGVMCGGIATGVVGIVGAFVYGNAKEHAARNGHAAGN